MNPFKENDELKKEILNPSVLDQAKENLRKPARESAREVYDHSKDAAWDNASDIFKRD